MQTKRQPLMRLKTAEAAEAGRVTQSVFPLDALPCEKLAMSRRAQPKPRNGLDYAEATWSSVSPPGPTSVSRIGTVPSAWVEQLRQGS